MMELFGLKNSRSNRPQWALEELEVPYTFYRLDLRAGDARTPKFLKVSPMGKVPALKDGDLTMIESGAICNYIGNKYKEKGLVPEDGTLDRARYDELMFFVMTELEQPLWTKGKHTFALPEAWRVQAVWPTAKYEFQLAVKVMANFLGDREFFVADRITMVDICVAHTLMWALKFEFEVPHENLLNHMNRMKERPSYQRLQDAESVDFAEYEG